MLPCMSFQFLQEGLPSCFGLGTHLTELTEFRLKLRVELDTGNLALCNLILDSYRCDVAKFPVGFTDSQLDHHNACIVDSGGLLHCCYMVEAIGAQNCHHGATTWIMDGTHASTECCRAFHPIKPAYQNECECHIQGVYCLLEYGLGALHTIQ